MVADTGMSMSNCHVLDVLFGIDESYVRIIIRRIDDLNRRMVSNSFGFLCYFIKKIMFEYFRMVMKKFFVRQIGQLSTI